MLPSHITSELLAKVEGAQRAVDNYRMAMKRLEGLNLPSVDALAKQADLCAASVRMLQGARPLAVTLHPGFAEAEMAQFRARAKWASQQAELMQRQRAHFAQPLRKNNAQ